MTTAWSEKTKEKLIAVDKAIENFVTKNWQGGSVEPVANAWSDFVLAESFDSDAQGFGKKPITRDINRGYRDYPFFNGTNLDFLRKYLLNFALFHVKHLCPKPPQNRLLLCQ